MVSHGDGYVRRPWTLGHTVDHEVCSGRLAVETRVSASHDLPTTGACVVRSNNHDIVEGR